MIRAPDGMPDSGRMGLHVYQMASGLWMSHLVKDLLMDVVLGSWKLNPLTALVTELTKFVLC